jgi:hypothetical protein
MSEPLATSVAKANANPVKPAHAVFVKDLTTDTVLFYFTTRDHLKRFASGRPSS